MAGDDDEGGAGKRVKKHPPVRRSAGCRQSGMGAWLSGAGGGGDSGTGRRDPLHPSRLKGGLGRDGTRRGVGPSHERTSVGRRRNRASARTVLLVPRLGWRVKEEHPRAPMERKDGAWGPVTGDG